MDFPPLSQICQGQYLVESLRYFLFQILTTFCAITILALAILGLCRLWLKSRLVSPRKRPDPKFELSTVAQVFELHYPDN